MLSAQDFCAPRMPRIVLPRLPLTLMIHEDSAAAADPGMPSASPHILANNKGEKCGVD